MAGTWALARAAFAAALHGQTATPTDHDAQTLNCSEWPIKSRQTVFPYAYVIPADKGEQVTRFPGAWTAITSAPRVRIVLSASTDMPSVVKQYDAWKPVVANAFDTKLTLDGNCDYVGQQSIGPLAHFDEDDAWGFEIEFENFRVSHADTFEG